MRVKSERKLRDEGKNVEAEEKRMETIRRLHPKSLSFDPVCRSHQVPSPHAPKMKQNQKLKIETNARSLCFQTASHKLERECDALFKRKTEKE
mmetsp:Transcript_5291/g.10483  ORF Transcript_5291/g.10483 Transcript_5291/m.10483 type:complete len:93 (-) Transcript_5291:2790-3068(-)